MKIIGVSGSLRKNSFNTWLLTAAAELVPDGVDFEIITIDRVENYNEDLDAESKPEAAQSFINSINQADAILFAVPEYNHSIPGVLKNAIDWASRPGFSSPLLSKPCGILTASKTPVGGARGQAHMKAILSSTLSLVFPSVEYLLPNAHEKYNAEGELVDETARRRLQKYIAGLIDWTLNQKAIS